MLSSACKYAIRAMLYLALHSREDRKIGVKEIGETLEIPKPFLAQLFRTLTTNELVSSTKGPGGGYFLSDENRQRTVWDIVLCIDGPSKFDSCFLGLDKCDDQNPCPVHYAVGPFKKKILADFKFKSIDMLAAEITEKGTLISLKGINLAPVTPKPGGPG
jgi:Rrf2 family protein